MFELNLDQMTTNKLISNIIKKSFSIIISIFSLFSYSQKISNEKLFESTKNWVYSSYGNPIDGFKRVSIKTNNNYKEDGIFMLSIENSAESIKLKMLRVKEKMTGMIYQ